MELVIIEVSENRWRFPLWDRRLRGMKTLKFLMSARCMTGSIVLLRLNGRRDRMMMQDLI